MTFPPRRVPVKDFNARPSCAYPTWGISYFEQRRYVQKPFKELILPMDLGILGIFVIMPSATGNYASRPVIFMENRLSVRLLFHSLTSRRNMTF